jgi:beta-barrel assembly-enhancing protease
VDSAQEMLDASGVGLDLDSEKNLKLLTELTDGVVDSLQSKGFEPEQELEADRLAIEMLINAGYNPHEYLKFLGKIPKSGEGNVSHHPPNEERQKKLRAHFEVLRQDPNFLAGDEYPFERLAVVKLGNELAAAR